MSSIPRKQLGENSSESPGDGKGQLSDIKNGQIKQKISSSSIGDQLPPNLQRLLLQYLQTKANQMSSPVFSNTTIRIRIPAKRTPKKSKKKREDDGEFDEQESYRVYKDSTYRSNHFSFRPPTPTANRFPQPKRVLTPDWESAQSASVRQKAELSRLPQESDEIEREWNKLDRTEHHRRLEIFENRIIWGFDEVFQHPAQSVNVALQGMSFVLSQEETQKSERYEQAICQHTVPKFWEPRIWDNPEDSLNEQQTNELLQKIMVASHPPLTKQTQSHSNSKKLPKRSLSVAISTPKRGKARRDQADHNILILPIANYITDDEDDLSEWEDKL